jgi:hypothetical protein
VELCQTRSSVVQAPLEHQKGPEEPINYYERGAVNSLSTALGGDAPEAVAHNLCARRPLPARARLPTSACAFGSSLPSGMARPPARINI